RWWHRVRGKEDPYLKIGEVNDRTKSAKQARTEGTTNHTNKYEKLTTTERLGGCEEEQPKVGPKGEGVLKGHLQARLKVGLQKRRQTGPRSCQHRILHPC
ncbi:MAG: hypothetical protein ACKOF3_06270, partial [Spartobacteria bacterium]